MPTRVPELQMIYDEKCIPVSAKCSLCGEAMPQRKTRIKNTLENIEWLTAQFRLHVARMHLEAWTGKSLVQ